MYIQEKVEELIIPDDVQERLKKNVSSGGKGILSNDSRIQIYKKYCGYCKCGQVANKLVTTYIQDAQLLERLCNSCYDKRGKYN